MWLVSLSLAPVLKTWVRPPRISCDTSLGCFHSRNIQSTQVGPHESQTRLILGYILAVNDGQEITVIVVRRSHGCRPDQSATIRLIQGVPFSGRRPICAGCVVDLYSLANTGSPNDAIGAVSQTQDPPAIRDVVHGIEQSDRRRLSL